MMKLPPVGPAALNGKCSPSTTMTTTTTITATTTTTTTTKIGFF